MTLMLYHGTTLPSLAFLVPSPHSIVGNESVVFATRDIRFALAMIHGTGKDLDIGYHVDNSTGDEEMYIKELTPRAFELLTKPGIVYSMEDSGFVPDQRLSHRELISKDEVWTISEIHYENILDELKKYDIDFIGFDQN